MIVDVYEFGEKDHSSGKPFRLPVKGEEREVLYNEIRIKGATNVAAEKMAALDDAEFNAGNYSGAPVKKTLNNITYEFNKSQRLHDNPVFELELARQIWEEADLDSTFLKGYVHLVTVYPFKASFFTERQLEIYIAKAKQKSLVLHLDSTGGIIKNKGLKPTGKQVYFYALVVAGNTEEKIASMPLAEFMTNRHTAPTITHWLEEFLLSIQKFKGTKYLPSVVVTDFSWALLNSVCKTFNGRPLIDYINKCYVAMTENDNKFLDDKTIIHICAAHLLKFVFNQMKDIDGLKEAKHVAKFAFARLVTCDSLFEASTIFNSMCAVFCSKYESDNVNKNLDYLRKKIVNISSNEVNSLDDESESSANSLHTNIMLGILQEKQLLNSKDVETYKTYKTLRETSLFFFIF